MIQKLDMAECQKCHLAWVYRDEQVCPRCWHFDRLAGKLVVVCGVEVEIERLYLYGDQTNLADRRVRQGIDKLRLGERCCSYISWRICPKHFKQGFPS